MFVKVSAYIIKRYNPAWVWVLTPYLYKLELFVVDCYAAKIDFILSTDA